VVGLVNAYGVPDTTGDCVYNPRREEYKARICGLKSSYGIKKSDSSE